MRVFSIVEEGAISIAEEELAPGAAERIATHYASYVSLRLEVLGPQRYYSLRSRGYIGLFPLNKDSVLHVVPKVSCASVWGMLDYAYKLGKMRWMRGSVPTESLEGIASSLAEEFIELMQARLRRGLAWDFTERQAAGTPLRGKIVGPDFRSSWSLRYRFAEGGTDHLINQVPLWALHHLCTMPWNGPLQQRLKRLYRTLATQVGLEPVGGQKMLRLSYGRSRADYAPLHYLSRFFLEGSGPGIGRGLARITPFILHMPSLYEACMAQWMVDHYADRYAVKRQWQVAVPGSHPLSFRIDLALLDLQTGAPRAVFDTKYKLDLLPSPADVQQMAAYAVHLGVRCGFLLYPHDRMKPGILHVGDVEVHALGFDFAGGVGCAGGKQVLDYINCHINKFM